MATTRDFRLVPVSRSRGMARVLDRILTLRSYWAQGLSMKSNDGWIGETPTATGVPVSEFTALNLSSVWAAVNRVSGDIASLPLQLLQQLPDGGKKAFQRHGLYRLLHDQPNPEMTSMAWRRGMQAHAMTWGNGYSEIVRDNATRPAEIWPITPDRVRPFRRANGGKLQYEIENAGNSNTILDAADIVHLPGLGFDGVTGYSVIAKARESIGLGLAAERFGGSFFGNGATFGGIITYKGPKPPELSEKNYLEGLNSRHQGVERAHKLLALYNGADYKQLGIPPDDAQFLETRQFQVTEIARWFNIPPHKIGDLSRSTHSNIEQQEIDYYVGSLMPWLQLWEQELAIKLIARSEFNLQTIEHNLEGRLRGDTQARGEFYSKRFSVGSIKPNEIRELENEPPLAGGDRAFVPLNMIPLDRVDEFVDAQIAKMKAPKPTPAAPNPGDKAATEAAMNRVGQLEQELAVARRLIQEGEDAKDRALAELAQARADWLNAADERAIREADRATADAEKAIEYGRLVKSLETAERTMAETEQARQQAIRRIEAIEQHLADERASSGHAAEERAAEIARLTEALRAAEERCASMSATHLAAIAKVDLIERQLVDERSAAAVAAEMRAAEIVRLTEVAESARQAMLSTLTLNQEASANLAALRQELGGVQAARDAAVARADAAAEALRTRGEAFSLDLAAARQEAAEELAAARVITADISKMFAESTMRVRAAARVVLADAVTRIVVHQADRARKAQASPEKLVRWIDSYYSIQTENFRQWLKPAARAWEAAFEERLGIDALITAHCAESERELRAVAGESDAESLAPALERLLRRWETDRPEAFVTGLEERHHA